MTLTCESVNNQTLIVETKNQVSVILEEISTELNVLSTPIDGQEEQTFLHRVFFAFWLSIIGVHTSASFTKCQLKRKVLIGWHQEIQVLA